VNKRLLASWVGKVTSFHLAFPTMRLYMASFYIAISSSDSWERNVKVRLSNEAMKALKGFWQNIPSELLVGSFNRSLDRSIIFTDASLAGWGAHFEN
jgi:hypothetical protein